LRLPDYLVSEVVLTGTSPQGGHVHFTFARGLPKVDTNPGRERLGVGHVSRADLGICVWGTGLSLSLSLPLNSSSFSLLPPP